MLVRIMYEDGSFDMVRNDMLDILVANQRVKKIRRQSGWIDVESGQIRHSLGKPWDGLERRAPWPQY